MKVTLESKIHTLLEEYPELESFLIELNPKYKKLKNPVLRRTVARVATLSQVARIGGYEPVELLNLLRKELGESPIKKVATEEENFTPKKECPEWVRREATLALDGNALLDAGKNPLAEVRKALRTLPKDSTIALLTDFYPAPIIETLEKEGLKVWSEEKDGGYRTRIQGTK